MIIPRAAASARRCESAIVDPAVFRYIPEVAAAFVTEEMVAVERRDVNVIPPIVVGRGFRPEHVRTPDVHTN